VLLRLWLLSVVHAAFILLFCFAECACHCAMVRAATSHQRNLTGVMQQMLMPQRNG
jgi:hypothetical protein